MSGFVRTNTASTRYGNGHSVYFTCFQQCNYGNYKHIKHMPAAFSLDHGVYTK